MYNANNLARSVEEPYGVVHTCHGHRWSKRHRRADERHQRATRLEQRAHWRQRVGQGPELL